jgi:protein-S-isoprenylcysteine O-methyltransferase Ste14
VQSGPVLAGDLHLALWLGWLLYWFISARGTKRTVRRETLAQRWIYALPLAVAMVLFTMPPRSVHLLALIFPPTWTLYWIGTALLVAGLAFSIWARVTLGRNWSGIVTVKEDHELIQTGPYRLVRHPFYTGLLLALTGSALARDRWSSVAAVALIFVSFWIKLLREEAWMRETFGEKYEAYCARTKRLVPYVW